MARGLIPTSAPEWTNHNPSDPGITLIELFAWFVETDLYRLNRLPAKQRLKFLKLLGVPCLQPAQPAFIEALFTLLGPGPAFIPQGTAISARDPLTGEEVFFETVADLTVEGIPLVKLLAYRAADAVFVDNTDANQNEQAYFLVFGEEPAQGDALYLGFADPPAGPLTIGFSLVDRPRTGLEQIPSAPRTTSAPSSAPTGPVRQPAIVALPDPDGDFLPMPVEPEVIARDEHGHVTVRITRLQDKLTTDGRLDEPVYQQVRSMGDFIQQEPKEGQPSSERTEAWVFFDDKNIYVSARSGRASPAVAGRDFPFPLLPSVRSVEHLS